MANFALPAPTYNINTPAIKQIVEQIFPLGALLAGILGYGQQDNVKAQERAVLGL